jgi:DNA-directed RNA polymerase specialized sigma24 family protein
MPSDDSGSISHWLGALRGDDLEAAQPLLHRYSASLVQFAQAGARGRVPRIFEALHNREWRRITAWKLEGRSVDETAARLGCARRTVAGRLKN